MDKLLKIQVAVLLCLVAVSFFVRLGIVRGQADTGDEGMNQTQENISDNQNETPTEPTTEPATEAPTLAPTEPEIVLTFSEDFSLESREYFLYHCGRDEVLFSFGNMDKKIYPASVTKLFTAYVALQYMDPDTVVTIGDEIKLVEPNSSLAYIQVGQRIAVRDLIEGMLLPSGNDAAYALAVATARAHYGDATLPAEPAVASFVSLMNKTAEKEGMNGSHFMNPDGYHDADHYTTGNDLITIAKLALSSDVIMRCTGTYLDDVEFASGETASWHNTNALINPESQYYCENALGLKTGNTSAAGFCLLSAFEVDGEYIIIGSFACLRPEDRFIDTLKIYDVYMNAVNG